MDVADEVALLAKRMSTTSHARKAGETAFHYRATAGSLPVRAGHDESECRIFFTGYEIESERRVPRPLTFAFNGGPGASSAYLHLAALGPRCVMINEDGSLPAQPARLFENPHAWLWFTDLVFVDPVGTGYSRCVCKRAR
jgi:carboxypeptidase C (cathepsin A)